MTKAFQQNQTDVLVATAKSIFGILPMAGPLLSELVGNLIPNQRIDRLSKYVRELEDKLSKLDKEKIIEALKSDECIDLIEEGFYQASRAITDERRAYIANVVANGMDDERIEFNESKYVLKIIQELNEQEIIWLRFYVDPTIGGDVEFRQRHKNVLEIVRAFIGSDERSRERSALQESYREHLERLGLIAAHYSLDSDTGLPKFDRISGAQKVSFRTITSLGSMVLKQINFNEVDGKKNY